MSAKGERVYPQQYDVVFQAAQNAIVDSRGKLKSANPQTGEIKGKGKSDVRTMMGEKIKIQVSQAPQGGTLVKVKVKAEGAMTSFGKTDETLNKYFAALDGRLMGGAGAPAPPPPQGGQTCKSCNGPLTFVQQYQKWYCYTCQKYA
ncbi:MAG: hypothetical protein JSV49_07160 [Thermoplasmata archaeon]|nr:MAG: hypothetical protein JSV49_07160 [Thermoplasmata archaeon]